VIWDHAARTAAGASAAIGHLAGGRPGIRERYRLGRGRHAASRLGRARQPRPPAGRDAYDRAAREPWRRLPLPSPAGNQLRSAARLLSAVAYVSRDRPLAHIALVVRLVALAEAVGELRAAQQRAA
jgi:hypothetical protein